MKKRKATKARPAPAFTPDDFYERLLVMREKDPASVLRFGRETLASLRAYEEAKRRAAQAQRGGGE